MNAVSIVLLSMLVPLGSTTLVSAQDGRQMMMNPRVPADKLAEARALKNPLSDSPEVIQRGKTIYEGKGTCFNCHGMQGRGNGPAAASLDPPPRNFRSHGFWRHRSEGELFWVVKHGIQGTGMIPFGGTLSDEEIWAVLEYERTFAGGPGRGRHGRDMARTEGQKGGGMAAPDRPRRRMESHEEMRGRHDRGGEGRRRAMGCPEVCDMKALAESVRISVADAIKAAQDHTPGTVIEAELENKAGNPVWEIELVTEDGHMVELTVDGVSGEVRSSEDAPAGEHSNCERMRGTDKCGRGDYGDGRKSGGCCDQME